MTAQAPATAPRRTGRPRAQAGATPTRERLLDAASSVFAEQGSERASLTEIAARAGISGPAAYKHFASKADLLIHAARHSLDNVSAAATTSARTPIESARRWLSPDFAATRRLVLELHLAAGREHDLLELLAEWHLEQAAAWQERSADGHDRIKVFYLLLLGLSQIDVLAAIDADHAQVQHHVEQMVSTLFPEYQEPR